MQSVLYDNSKSNLSEKHRAELHASGLSDEAIAAAGIYTVTSDAEIARLIGWTSRIFNWGPCMVFPYAHADGYFRIKPDFPRFKDGKPIKYESPLGKTNRAYFPPGFWELLAKSKIVIITEGEKKALKIQQDTGLPCIGLVGVYGWQQARPKAEDGKTYGKRQLIADLESIDWKNREVIIVFDSDAVTNDLVRFAEFHLALALMAKGAAVRIARIPADGPKKIGADDFLVAHGVDAFRRVLVDAEEADQPPAPEPMDWARMYIAEFYSHADGPMIRWHREGFYVYRDTHYVAMPDSEIQSDILQFLDLRGTKATPHLASDVRQCLASEIRVPHHIDPPALLTASTDNPHNLVALRNGILNLDDVLQGRPIMLRPHSPTWFSTFALDFDYNPTAVCEAWFKALDEIFDGDEERIDLLGEWFGYCITNDTRLQAMLMLQGPKRSGKGTIMRALTAVLGACNCVAPRLTQLCERFGLAELMDKRAAIIPDAHLGHGDKALAVLELLKLISGEDAISVERKFKPAVSVRLRTRFTLGVNELPKFGDGAGALGPRVRILPTRNSFVGREDRDLEQKISAELPAVFNWAMDGLLRLHRQGEFTKPQASREIEADFARLVSPLTVFLQDECDVRPSAKVARNELWERWKSWCIANGHLPGTREVFGSKLRTLIPHLDGTNEREGGERVRYYVGIGLKEVVQSYVDAG